MNLEQDDWGRRGNSAMKFAMIPIVLPLFAAIGCASQPAPPIEQAANVQSAVRSATELGARGQPNAQLHLKLAEDQLAQARLALSHDDNAAATRLLGRAKADAELAIALTRENEAEQGANAARASLDAQTVTNEGATP